MADKRLITDWTSLRFGKGFEFSKSFDFCKRFEFDMPKAGGGIVRIQVRPRRCEGLPLIGYLEIRLDLISPFRHVVNQAKSYRFIDTCPKEVDLPISLIIELLLGGKQPDALFHHLIELVVIAWITVTSIFLLSLRKCGPCPLKRISELPLRS